MEHIALQVNVPFVPYTYLMPIDSQFPTPKILERFIEDVYVVLRGLPQGIGEYDLLQALRENGRYSFLLADVGDTYALFRAHFMLSHALYRLRYLLKHKQEAHVDIGLLQIKLLPYQSSEQGLDMLDKLSAYYLDFSNLEQITSKEVDALIASFWVDMHQLDHREDALAELGLSDPVDDQTIKLTYKKLVMKHHPDRGGDKERLQTINTAMDGLIKTRNLLKMVSNKQ